MRTKRTSMRRVLSLSNNEERAILLLQFCRGFGHSPVLPDSNTISYKYPPILPLSQSPNNNNNHPLSSCAHQSYTKARHDTLLPQRPGDAIPPKRPLGTTSASSTSPPDSASPSHSSVLCTCASVPSRVHPDRSRALATAASADQWGAVLATQRHVARVSWSSIAYCRCDSQIYSSSVNTKDLVVGSACESKDWKILVEAGLSAGGFLAARSRDTRLAFIGDDECLEIEVAR
ncbi:hypothetical protein BJ742DRAFT_420375 [Cladochytrium replicatum]|nr:hypothetical protein BJ742DRAFT_420375 [Cladochytrium replicatum]